MAERGLELLPQTSYGTIPHGWRRTFELLDRATFWALKAWALVLLDKQATAREGIEAAANSLAMALEGMPNLRQVPVWGSYYVTPYWWRLDYPTIVRQSVSETQWTIGMALLAMQDTGGAGEHFRIAAMKTPEAGTASSRCASANIWVYRSVEQGRVPRTCATDPRSRGGATGRKSANRFLFTQHGWPNSLACFRMLSDAFGSDNVGAILTNPVSNQVCTTTRKMSTSPTPFG
jgi:hypothetical protein